MAPTDVSHEPNSYLHALLLSFGRLERRDEPQGTSISSSTMAVLVAAIAILSAIILGYAAYRGFKWYRARSHHPSAISPSSIKSSRFKHNGPAEITIASSNYEHFAAMSQTKGPYTSPRHDQGTGAAFSPLPQTASTTVLNGTHTPNLDWRPPVLTPWLKNGHSQGGSDSTSDVEVHRVEMNQVDGIPYPSQTYSSKGKRRGSGGVFAFMRTAANGISSGLKTGEKNKFGDGAYLMVHGSPPISSPPAQFLPRTADGNSRDFDGVGLEAGVIGISHNEENGNMFRSLGGATSPPLPPLPQRTSALPETSRWSESTQATSRAIPSRIIPAPINLAPPPPSAASRPLSRAPTTKSNRFTAMSSLNGHGAIPSPRVSSLFRASSRLSHHHVYTPASPGLPNPPLVPPIPALPAHLSRLPSMSKTITSTGSTDTHAKHDSAISTSTIHGDASVEAAEDPTKGPDGMPLPRTMVVTCTFTPSLSDELPLTIGETVSMLEEYIDEWCFVQRVRVMVKDGASRAPGGVGVSVHGTVDVQNTITVPVSGEGNLGAVPRFCLSEWPLAISDTKEEEQAVMLGQETPTGLPMFTPPALFPSPPSSSTTPTFSPGRMDPARQPLLAPTMAARQPTPKAEGQVVRPRPLPTPTPKAQAQHLDSNFSNWGSVDTQAPMPMPDVSGLRRNQNATTANLAPFPTLLGPQPVNEGQRSAANSIHPLSSSTSSHAPMAAGSASSHMHPLAIDSRTPSFSSAATSIAPPVVPPTSPDSQSPSNASPVEDDNIRRVSKPPLAPRLSRFPPTPDEDEPSMHMYVHGHSRNPSREGGIPRAAERTVTMPPLPRRPSASDPSTAESPTPTQQQNNPPIHSTVANISANTHWGNGFSSRDNFLPAMTPSTSTDIPSTGLGTSVGSKTPSTAATSTHSSPPVKGAFAKRFTAAAAQVARSGSLNKIHPSARPPMGTNNQSYGGRGAAGPEKKAGPGMVNFKALRTGSSTAGVGPVGR